LPLVLHNFRMAANHGRCAPSYITDDHHRRLLTGDHLHHGLLSGVRNSCDRLARNSDLYFETRATCSAFSFRDFLACTTSRFLISTLVFLFFELFGFLFEFQCLPFERRVRAPQSFLLMG
jgi:hypothetical protein